MQSFISHNMFELRELCLFDSSIYFNLMQFTLNFETKSLKRQGAWSTDAGGKCSELNLAIVHLVLRITR